MATFLLRRRIVEWFSMASAVLAFLAAGLPASAQVDIGPCAVQNGGCSTSPLVACKVESGSVVCDPCPEGYTGDGRTCRDIDECRIDNGGCSPVAHCQNVPGSVLCGPCRAGYTGNGKTCTDIDECATNNGGCSRTPVVACTNQVGTFECGLCPGGYTGDGRTCTDIDECATGNGGCSVDPRVPCANLPGSMRCAGCPQGYAGDGKTCFATGGVCPPGYTTSADGTCANIDECAVHHGGCDAVAPCLDQVPMPSNGFVLNTCGPCPEGYTGSGESRCVDVNECLADNGGCDPLAMCVNVPGDRLCTCPPGYEGDGETCTNRFDVCEQGTAAGCRPIDPPAAPPAGVTLCSPLVQMNSRPPQWFLRATGGPVTVRIAVRPRGTQGVGGHVDIKNMAGVSQGTALIAVPHPIPGAETESPDAAFLASAGELFAVHVDAPFTDYRLKVAGAESLGRSFQSVLSYHGGPARWHFNVAAGQDVSFRIHLYGALQPESGYASDIAWRLIAPGGTATDVRTASGVPTVDLAPVSGPAGTWTIDVLSANGGYEVERLQQANETSAGDEGLYASWMSGGSMTIKGSVHLDAEFGTLTDEVTLTTPDGLAIASTATDSTGRYQFTDVLPGRYVVTVRPPDGFTAAPESQTLDVACGDTISADFDVRLTDVPTTLTYLGAPTATFGLPYTAEVRLTRTDDGMPVFGQGVRFTTPSGTFPATTGPSGIARVQFAALPLGAQTITVAFTGTPGGGLLASTVSASVTVVDGTPPVLSLPTRVEMEATGPTTPVTWTATGTDTVDGGVAVTCVPARGSAFPIGTTRVSCSAADAAQNRATGGFDVTVRDTTPPVVVAPADITIEATGPAGAAVSFRATATDVVSSPLTATCAPASGSTFAIGATTVTCSATDTGGNTGRDTVTVTVRDSDNPGLMLGEGRLEAPGARVSFEFAVWEWRAHENGRFRLDVDYSSRGRSDDSFRAERIEAVFFSDEADAVARRRRPVDIVVVTGTGAWNGRRGYTFEARAEDREEPRRRGDTFAITVRSPQGAAVASFSGVITSGDIHSVRRDR